MTDELRALDDVYRLALRMTGNRADAEDAAQEALGLDFERFAADLMDGLEPGAPREDPAAAEEVKLGCTLAMLTCLGA